MIKALNHLLLYTQKTIVIIQLIEKCEEERA